ncbi:hypothetical protein F4859DRAFT_207448 [Xylaria cf. heliscus]|nr:hypothetical protein F4859DRAFT_207448 [Xylaria cf. heliscus]
MHSKDDNLETTLEALTLAAVVAAAASAASAASAALAAQKAQGHRQMCTYMFLKWYCDDCGAWYTSDEIKTSDCDDFLESGDCDERDFTTEESDAGGLCDECTQAREG